METKHRPIRINGEIYLLTFEEVRSYTSTDKEAKKIWEKGEVELNGK